jgi:protein SCO1/2
MHLKRFMLMISILSALLGAGLYALIFSTPPLEKDIRSQYLKGGDFELLHQGKPFKLSELKGQPVILYFGYSSCPDVCPVGLAVIRDVLKSAEEFSSIKALFVTVDPQRDTPEVLQEYTQFFHPNIVPLTGTFEEIKAVIESYGGFLRHHRPISDAQPNAYMVDHTAYYYLIDANSELVRVLDHSVSAEDIAGSLRRLL